MTVSNAVIGNSVTFDVLSGGVLAGTIEMGRNAVLSVQSANEPVAVTLSRFDATDQFRVEGLDGGAKLSFVETADNKQGTLTISEYGYTVTVTLFGQYAAAGFQGGDPSAGGVACNVTYQPPAEHAAQTLLARHH